MECLSSRYILQLLTSDPYRYSTLETWSTGDVLGRTPEARGIRNLRSAFSCPIEHALGSQQSLKGVGASPASNQLLPDIFSPTLSSYTRTYPRGRLTVFAI